MLNRAIIQGRLVKDPELRHTQSGIAVTSMCVACERDFKSKDPNAQNADFINVVVWRQTAEFVRRYFTKGSMILIDGRLQSRSYTDNNGNKRTSLEIVAENVNFAGEKRNNNNNVNYGGDGVPTYNEPSGGGYGAQNYGGQPTYGGSYAATQQYAPQLSELPDDEEGELPF